METRNVFKTGVSAVIYTNTERLIKGNTVRDKFLIMADSVLFKQDDANVSGGFMAIDSVNGNVNIAFIKALSPTGKFLKDDGSWASIPSPLPDQTGNSGKALITNGSSLSWSMLIPSQTSNSGKFLTTNGTVTSWASLPSQFPDQTGNSGKTLVTNGSSVSWAMLIPSQTSNSGKFLTTNGSVTSWADVLPSQTGNNGKFLTTSGSALSWSTVPAPSPAGSTNQIQYNSGTSFAGSTRFLWRQSDNCFFAYGNSLFGMDPASNSPTAIIDIAAATSGISSLRIRSSGAATPTSPNDGDIWYNGTNIFIRTGGTNKRFTLA